MDANLGADSEVGRLRTVMLHRPGPELKRLTPRNNDSLLFDGIPWVGRAQEEHDTFAAALRERGHGGALPRRAADRDARAARPLGSRRSAQITASLRLGDTLRRYLSGWLEPLSAEELAGAITAGIRNDEVRGGFGLVTSLLPADDFVIDPLPNLLFTRDSSVWLPRGASP